MVLVMLLLGHMQKQMGNHCGHRRFTLKNQAQFEDEFPVIKIRHLVERSSMNKTLETQ